MHFRIIETDTNIIHMEPKCYSYICWWNITFRYHLNPPEKCRFLIDKSECENFFLAKNEEVEIKTTQTQFQFVKYLYVMVGMIFCFVSFFPRILCMHNIIPTQNERNTSIGIIRAWRIKTLPIYTPRRRKAILEIGWKSGRWTRQDTTRREKNEKKHCRKETDDGRENKKWRVFVWFNRKSW